jgi:hypothetical protein
MKKERTLILQLKVELDNGASIQTLKLYQGDSPDEVVSRFAKTFNLGRAAKQSLLQKVKE